MAKFNPAAYEKARVSAFGLNKTAAAKPKAKPKKPKGRAKPSYTPYKYPNT